MAHPPRRQRGGGGGTLGEGSEVWPTHPAGRGEEGEARQGKGVRCGPPTLQAEGRRGRHARGRE